MVLKVPDKDIEILNAHYIPNFNERVGDKTKQPGDQLSAEQSFDIKGEPCILTSLPKLTEK